MFCIRSKRSPSNEQGTVSTNGISYQSSVLNKPRFKLPTPPIKHDYVDLPRPPIAQWKANTANINFAIKNQQIMNANNPLY